MQIAVVDLGAGNLRSVQNAFNFVNQGVDVSITSDPDVILRADKIVLPGQGAMGEWRRQLHMKRLSKSLGECLQTKPVLAICVGMQALFEMSEESGGVGGFALFAGRVSHFSRIVPQGAPERRLKIPHMGWNEVNQHRQHVLWSNIPNHAHFYFVHSFCAISPAGADSTVGTTTYGKPFVSAATRGPVFAVQFHPEKSQRHGLQLIKNFIHWKGDAST